MSKYRGMRDKFLSTEMAQDIMNEYHFCRINGTLHIWDGKKYTPDVEELIGDIAFELDSSTNETHWKDVYTKIKKLSKRDKNITEFDNVDPYRIAFENGVLELTELKFESNETGEPWRYAICNVIPRNYNPDAKEVPEVVATIKQWANNEDDVERLLWEVIGFPMLVDCNLKTIFFLYGEGDCGKTTFVKYMQKLYGSSNFTTFDIDDIDDRFNRATSCNKLFNFGDEINAGYIPKPNYLKRLSSGQTMQVENKGKDGYQALFYSKLIFAMNELPKINVEGNMNAWERINIINFKNQFEKNPLYDKTVGAKLYTDEAFEYVLQRAAKSIHNVINKGYFDHRDPEMWDEFMGNNVPMLWDALKMTIDNWNVYKRNGEEKPDPQRWFESVKGYYKGKTPWMKFAKQFNKFSDNFHIRRTSVKKGKIEKQNVWVIETKEK